MTERRVGNCTQPCTRLPNKFDLPGIGRIPGSGNYRKSMPSRRNELFCSKKFNLQRPQRSALIPGRCHFGSSCALGRGTAPVRQYPKGFYVIEAEISLVRAIKQTLNLRLLVTYN